MQRYKTVFLQKKMVFEWDETKNSYNKKKHHVSFEKAAKVFLDENRIVKYDEAHSTLEEERAITIGIADEMLFVVYTERLEKTRIISARLAARMNAMSIMKQMTLEEIKNVPPMTETERKELQESPIVYDEDCPKLSKQELSEFRPYKDISKDKRPVTLRLSETDIFALKQKAKMFGLPYQTLVSSVLHRYINDELVDKSEVKKIFAMTN